MANQYNDRDYERSQFGRRPEEYRQSTRGLQERGYERGYEGQGRDYRDYEERGYRERGEGELRAQFGNEDYGRQRRFGESRFEEGRYGQGENYGNYGDTERYSARPSRSDYEQRGSEYGRNREQYGQGGSRGYAGGRDDDRTESENWTDFGGGRGYGGERTGERNWREESRGYGGYGESGYRENESWSMRGPHTGHGPQGYKRSDERITEDVNERLTQHGYLDASMIQVKVKDGEVTLTGTVPDRQAKRLAEDIAEACSGVKEVQNQLRVKQEQQTSGQSQATGQQGQHEMKRSATK